MTDNMIADRAVIPGTGSYEWCLDTGELRWSAGLLQVYGLSFAPDRAEDFLDVVHPEDQARLRSEIDEACADRDSFEHRFRIVLPDGRVRVLLDRGVVARDSAGRALRLTGVETDVTDLCDGLGSVAPVAPPSLGPDNPRLLDSEILDAVFNDAPVGIGIWNRDLEFVKINPMLAAMNGLAPEQHIGKTPKDLLPEVHDIDAVTGLLNDVMQSGTARRDVEISGSTPAAPGETRYWREHFFPIRSGGEVRGLAAVAEDVTVQRKAQQTIDDLLLELNHRSKNLVSLVLAICRQTAKTQPEAFLSVFQARLESMAAAQDLLVRRSWNDIGIEALVRSQIPHFADLIGSRILLRGPAAAVIPANAAQSLALAFHELTTNAVKYGALSTEEGGVTVTWQTDDSDQALEIIWQERGGPEVPQPSRKGFGSTLTGAMLRASLDAEIETDYAPSGLTWRLRCVFARGS